MTEAATDKGRAASGMKKGKPQAVQNMPAESNNAAHAEVAGHTTITFFRRTEILKTERKRLKLPRTQRKLKTRTYRKHFTISQEHATKIQVSLYIDDV